MATIIRLHWLTKTILGLCLIILSSIFIGNGYIFIYKTKLLEFLRLIGGEKVYLISNSYFLQSVTFLTIGYFIIYRFYLWRIQKGIGKLSKVTLTENIKRESFGKVFFISHIILFGWFGLLFYLGYNHINLNIDKSVFLRKDFDYNNPSYTDPNICKNFEGYIKNLPEISTMNKYSQNTALNSAIKNVILDPRNPEYQTITGEPYENSIGIAYLEANKSTPEFATALSLPEQGILSEAGHAELQKKIISLPDGMKCFERNDTNLSEELLPSGSYQIKTARILSRRANFLLWENKIDEAIDVLKTIHIYNKKLVGSNLTLVGQMLEIARWNIELSTFENIWNKASKESRGKLKELTKENINFEDNYKDALRGEYYYYTHLFGRGNEISKMSVGIMFNGEDMVNRGIILTYGYLLDENEWLVLINQNTRYLNTRQEANLIGSSINISYFGYLYNPIGKILNNALIPSLPGYKKRIDQTQKYYEYLKSMPI